MILDTALVLAPALVVALGLVIVSALALANSTARVGSVAERLVAVVTLFLALIATARLWLVAPGNPVDVPLLAGLIVNSGAQTPALLLETLHLDAVALIGLTAVLGLGLIAAAAAEESTVSRGTFAAILFVALLAVLMSLSADVVSVGTLWVAITLTLAALTLSVSRQASASGAASTGLVSLTPAIDARRWLLLVIVGSPVFWVVGGALVGAVGSSSLVGVRSAPAGIVVGLILIGAVVAGVAPFATRRFPHQRLAEIAYVVDGVLPVVGVVLAARAVAMIGTPRPVLPGIILALLGLSGVVSARLPLGRGRGIAGAGRIEGSIALLVLIAPTPLAIVGGVVVVGSGTLVRAIERLPVRRRLSWLRWPAALTQLPRPDVLAAESSLSRIVGRSVPALNRRIRYLVLSLAEAIAEYARQAEQRYDLAIGLLVALATVFIYYG